MNRHLLVRSACLAALTLALATPGRAHPGDASDASLVSTVPLAVSVAGVAGLSTVAVLAPSAVLSAGVGLTVLAVESTAQGVVWLLERASDGARLSVRVAGGSVLAVGTGVSVLSLATGWVLSAAGRVVCFVPNEIGASLLYNEQVTR